MDISVDAFIPNTFTFFRASSDVDLQKRLNNVRELRKKILSSVQNADPCHSGKKMNISIDKKEMPKLIAYICSFYQTLIFLLSSYSKVISFY